MPTAEPYDPAPTPPRSELAEQALAAAGRPNPLPWQYATDDEAEHEAYVSGQAYPQPHTMSLESVLDGHSPIGPVALTTAVVVVEDAEGFWSWHAEVRAEGDGFADPDVAMIDAERWLHEVALAVPPPGY
jgi:hypothetical protein